MRNDYEMSKPRKRKLEKWWKKERDGVGGERKEKLNNIFKKRDERKGKNTKDKNKDTKIKKRKTKTRKNGMEKEKR